MTVKGKGNHKYTIKREKGLTPNGNLINGRWVLRIDGKFEDFDQYINDLMERHNLDISI